MTSPVTRLTHSAADGFPLAVQLAGPADAPPLLLLQGQANSHHWWDHVRGGFEDRFRTVTFDYRGTGDSRGPVGAWSTGSFAADAADVLAGLGFGAVAVYGTSMGGRIAQRLAIDFPRTVGSLVLACTSPGGPAARERGNDIRKALSDPDPRRRREFMFELFYTAAWPQRPEDSVLLGDPTMTAAEANAHLRVSGRHDAWDGLPDITAPTLVLHGDDDRMVPTANAPVIAGRIPGAVLDIVTGGRHGFFEEFAGPVTAKVREFVDAHG